MSFITNITSSPATTGSYTNGYPTDVDNDQGNIRAGGTIAETGSFSSNALGEGNPSVVESGGHNISADVENASTLKSSGTDHAANPSSATPGELTQHQGVLGNPSNLDYKPRYLW